MGKRGMAKKLTQFRLEEELKNQARKETSRRGLNFTAYDTQLLNDDLNLQYGFPYVMIHDCNTITIDAAGTLTLETDQRLRFNERKDSYKYVIEFKTEKAREFLKSNKRPEDIWQKLEAEVYIDGRKETKKLNPVMLETGGYIEVCFPERPEGWEIDVRVTAELKEYALRSQADIGYAFEYDDIYMGISYPTDFFSLEVKISKEFFGRDTRSGRLLEGQILRNIEFYLKALDMLVLDKSKIYGHKFKARISEGKGVVTLQGDEYFFLKITTDRPIRGLAYGISWIRPKA